jgi:hypothetical protein
MKGCARRVALTIQFCGCVLEDSVSGVCPIHGESAKRHNGVCVGALSASIACRHSKAQLRQKDRKEMTTNPSEIFVSTTFSLPTDSFIAALASTSILLRRCGDANDDAVAQARHLRTRISSALGQTLREFSRHADEEEMLERDDYFACLLHEGTYSRVKKRGGRNEFVLLNTERGGDGVARRAPTYLQKILSTHGHLIKKQT